VRADGFPALLLGNEARPVEDEDAMRMMRWSKIGVGVVATLLLVVAACTISPAVEDSTPPATFGSPTAATADQSEPSAPTAVPSPPVSGPPPSMALPSAAPSDAAPDPTPETTPEATPQASLTSGLLRVDGLALVVADELRVRSVPGTGADSTIRGDPLTKGREVFLAAGPVAANGYDWWQVQVLMTGPRGRYGWVAAGHDSEIWLAPASVGCPPDPSVVDLARLGGARSLVCYGRHDLQIRVYRQPFCGDGITNAAGSPDWIIGVFGGDALFDRVVERHDDETALEIYGRAHPSLIESGTEYLGCGDAGTGWFDVTGHFDDPVSSDCRVSEYDPTTDESVEAEPALVVTWCRETFVYTEIRPASGP
jgi:hypothetical protein